MSYNIVWFKKDLRFYDHRALAEAAIDGPVLCLYMVEPALWAQGDASNRQYQFLRESLHDLHLSLKKHKGALYVLTGDACEVLERVFSLEPFSAVYSHEETGNAASYERDRAVARWCLAHDVRRHEFPQFGVVRRLAKRDAWRKHWQAHVNAPCIEPSNITWKHLALSSARMPTPSALGLCDEDPPLRQRGGREWGIATLQEFLAERSEGYLGGLSSPLKAVEACSRLSPYLSHGCVSLREIVQATRRCKDELPFNENRRRRGLDAFISRLYWHCHFIQKLESEPAIEFHNFHRGYDGLREKEWNQSYFDALVAARTGWPLVDACVVMLNHTGWLNFRMRAMLVSVAAYPLWLHWREVGLWLAKEFVDYEPGIHWSQLQMQSGTTGMNIPRIYNPIKQAQDQDPKGAFVRQWLPAMRRVPDPWIFEPWLMPIEIQQRSNVIIGVDLPAPIIDLKSATKKAKERLSVLRKRPEIQAALPEILRKHSSRTQHHRVTIKQEVAHPQLTMELEQ